MAPRRLVEIENIAEFRRNLRKADKDVRNAVKQLDKDTAGEIKKRAEGFVPTRTGRLLRSLKSGGDNKGGFLQAGTSSRVQYAPVIHWGFPRRNIKRTGFMLRGMSQFGREYDGDFANYYLQELMKVLDSFGETEK